MITVITILSIPAMHPVHCITGEGDHRVYQEGSQLFGSWQVGMVVVSIMVMSRVFLVEGEVGEEASINRSPTSYMANPAEERARCYGPSG